jgi:hypothetical protein
VDEYVFGDHGDSDGSRDGDRARAAFGAIDIDRGLVGLLDEARRAEAVAQRSRQRWLQEQAQESATFAGTLIDLAEARRSVVVETAVGSHHTGRIRDVGADVCLIETRSAQLVALRLSAVASVRTLDDHWPLPSSDRELRRARTFHAHMADLVAQRRWGCVVMSTVPVTGRLWALGADVVTVKLDTGGSGGFRACNLAAVTEVVSDAVVGDGIGDGDGGRAR